MKAILKHDFKCAPNGHAVFKLKEGQEVDGELAEYVIAKGVADEVKPKAKPKPKAKKTPKPKVAKKPKPKHEG